MNLAAPAAPSRASDWTTPLAAVAAGSFLLLAAALPWTIAPMTIATAICAALTLPLWVRTPSLVAERTPVDFPGLVWLCALVIAAACALDPIASFPRVTKGLMPAIVTLAAFHARTPAAGRRFLAVWLGSATLAALFGIAVFIAHGATESSRARGAVGHYMTFAGQLLLAVSVAAGVALAARRGPWRWGALAAALVGGVALAATFTRSAWLGMLVSLAVIFGARRPRLVAALGVAVVAALVFAPAQYRARALSVINPNDPTNRERTLMWEAGARMFRDHPLTGVGLEDLKPIYARYRSPAATEAAGHLHSVPVQIAATMGIAGLVAFVLLYRGLLQTALVGFRRQRRAVGVAAGVRLGMAGALAGFLVAGLFEWNLGDEELLYLLYTLAGLAWAARAWPAEASGTPTAGAAPALSARGASGASETRGSAPEPAPGGAAAEPAP